jgi:hypothetical protein
MNTRNFSAALGAALCAATLSAVAQTPNTNAPAQAPPTSTSTSAAPPSATPPTAVGADGKPLVKSDPPRVLADPDLKLYSRCTTGDEHEAADPGDSPYKPNPKAQVMTEEAAKAKGFKAGAHRVACK